MGTMVELSDKSLIKQERSFDSKYQSNTINIWVPTLWIHEIKITFDSEKILWCNQKQKKQINLLNSFHFHLYVSFFQFTTVRNSNARKESLDQSRQILLSNTCVCLLWIPILDKDTMLPHDTKPHSFLEAYGRRVGNQQWMIQLATLSSY